MNTYLQWALATPIILLEIAILWKFINSPIFSGWLSKKAKQLDPKNEVEENPQ